MSYAERLKEVENKMKDLPDKDLLGGIAFFNVVSMDTEFRAQYQPIIDLATKELDRRTENGTRTD
jgi:hypothetical protein